MESSEITKIIETEIKSNWALTNAHTVDLKSFLVRPEKLTYEDGNVNPTIRELWLVLEEDPVNHSGYQVVFDETTRGFGLATVDAATNRRIFLGRYGSFLDTFEAM